MLRIISTLVWLVVLLDIASCFHTGLRVRNAVRQPKARKMTMQGNFMDQLGTMFSSGSYSTSKGSLSGKRKFCVITGTTSGLGRQTVRSLLENYDNYYVIAANRNVEKAIQAAEEDGIDMSRYQAVDLDLGSFSSTRAFVPKLKKILGTKPLDALCCNAAVYQPALNYPKWTSDNIEEQLQINHLSHFLLASLLLPFITKADQGRVVIVGSITGNTNTIGGGLVLPFANLGDLKGMKNGSKNPISMIDGKTFNGAKAYKDSKICNMMTIFQLHQRYHAKTGVVFSSMYPVCIAETQLFREKREWFQKLFPLFMKYVTGGYVSEAEAGDRLAQTVAAPETGKSGVYWSWNGGAREIPKRDFKRGITKGTGGGGGGRESVFENVPSAEVSDETKGKLMWDYSTQITGAKWV
jgi:protochlorophyllide reductase